MAKSREFIIHRGSGGVIGHANKSLPNRANQAARARNVRNFTKVGKGNSSAGGVQSVSEPAVLANLLLWLKADSVTGKVDGDEMSAGEWLDSSTYERSMNVSGTTPNKPKYKTDQINGLPAMQVGQVSGTMYFYTPNFTSANGGDVFCVCKSDTDPKVSTNGGPLSFSHTGQGNMSVPNNAGTVQGAIASSTTEIFVLPKPATMTNWRLLEFSSGTKHRTFRYDDEIIYSTANNVVNWGTAEHKVGSSHSAGQNWNGLIAEVLVYDRELTSEERAQTVEYLTTKYALTANTDDAAMTPLSFPTGLKGYWDVSTALMEASFNNGDAVDIIPDDSGLSNHWIQSTTALKPEYVTNAYNGRSTLRFTSTKKMNGPSIAIPLSGDFTVIMVGKFNVDCSFLNNTATNVQFRKQTASNILSFWSGSNGASSGGLFNPATTMQMRWWKRASSVVSFGENGEPKTGAGHTEGFTINQLGVQPFGLSYQGDLCELAIWDSALTTSQICKLFEYYYREKWALPQT